MKQNKERLLHHVTITVFCKPHDDEQRVLKGLDELSPVPTAVLLQQDKRHDPERPSTVHYSLPDVTLTVQETETDDGSMKIFTLFFRKMSVVNHFARDFISWLTPDEHEEYRNEPERLLDYEAKLSFRLDKELLQNGKRVITDDGNCYQVKASIAAYPKTPEKILAALEKILSQSL